MDRYITDGYYSFPLSTSKAMHAAVSTIVLTGLLASLPAVAAIRSVGPGKPYATPCQAFAAANDGDTVEIDGTALYSGDVCGIYRNNLKIQGVNGRPKIYANGKNAMGKGIWVIAGSNTIIDRVEMYGAAVPDRNGAAIRLDGKHLTVRNSYFHNNEMGILTNNDGVSNVVITHSEFSHNGRGDGYSHNVYIGHVNSLTFRHNFSHDARVGHNLKSRAEHNYIAYNRFSSSIAQPSYEIDLPNAGVAYVIGNVIQQPLMNQNPGMLAFGMEGATNRKQVLYAVNNTFVNQDSSRGTFILVGSSVTTPVLMQNNVFAGVGVTTNQASALNRTNYWSLTPAFVDMRNFDLRPAPGSVMINAGSAPGVSPSGISLTPDAQYRHVAGGEKRPVDSRIDIGAYEAKAP